MKHPDDESVIICNPTPPTPIDFYYDNAAIATFTPSCSCEFIQFDMIITPDSIETWNDEFVGAGTITIVGDKILLIHPTNGFAGYDITFPKGRIDKGESLQAAAIRETFEETGVLVSLYGEYVDVERTLGKCRYYFARPQSGQFSDMCWESQAVSLVPINRLHEVITSHNDLPILERILNEKENNEIF